MRIFEVLASAEIFSLDAEILLARILNKNREWLFAHSDDFLDATTVTKFYDLVSRCQVGEPVAYLTHLREFFELDFFVDSRVLIPRPETEILVSEILKIQPQSLLDIGTGSGCIAVAVAKNLPNCRVIASDISADTLAVARLNADKQEVAVDFLQSDLLSNIKENSEVIAANLPYVPYHSTEIQKSVLKFEPNLAIFGGVDGLDIVRRLLVEVAELPKKPNFILLEIGHDQSVAVADFIKKIMPKSKISFKEDLAKIKRVVKIKLGNF